MLLKSEILFGLPEKMVMDPVHGGINFFDHEEEVIDNPLFQRLRFILQNDVLNQVFPGSQHTRFQHSIGTMHLAGKFFQGLIKSYLLEFKNKLDIDSSLIRSVNYVYGAIRLAALLHDTGHAPFSHQFEHSNKVSKFLNNDFFRKLWEGENYALYFKSIPTKVEHEHISIRITHEIFKKISNHEINVIDAIYFMEKSENDPSDVLLRHVENLIINIFQKTTFTRISKNRIFLSKIISIIDAPNKLLNALKGIISGEIDVDKMDYILRDSYFSGSKYGYYNLDVILNSLRIGYKYSPFKLRKLLWAGIAIDPKGLSAIEDFIYARFQLYTELYNHKTVCGFKYLLANAIDEVLEDDENFNYVYDCMSNINRYPLLTDTFLWEKFKYIGYRNQNSACYYLVNRRRIRFISKEKNRSIDQIREDLDKFENHYSMKICYWKSPLKFSNINEYFTKIRILKKNADGKKELIDISQATNFFNLFKERHEIIHYFEDPLQNNTSIK